jgi:hypothetical protein
MTTLFTRRRYPLSLLMGLLFAAFLPRITVDEEGRFNVDTPMAYAESGSGSGGKGGGSGNSNSGSGSGSDNSGNGSGSGNSGSGSGSGSGNSGGKDDGGNSSNNRGSRKKDPSSVTSDLRGSGSNLHLIYSNAWEEKIKSGRYVLRDPYGQTVKRRAATQADLERMRKAAGK